MDGNGDGIADAEQSDVVGLRMINDGAENTDYGVTETDPYRFIQCRCLLPQPNIHSTARQSLRDPHRHNAKD